MNTIGIALLALSVLVFLPACGASKQRKIEQDLQSGRTVNCTTAEGDLRVLENEKTNVAEQMGAGVTAIFPAGIVTGLVMGTQGTKVRVATGQYNKMLDERIAQIKAECGIEGGGD